MGIFDKLKNVFFEEEEVEVEEAKEEKERVPVAKKIDVEETKKSEHKEVKENKLELSDTLEFDKKEEKEDKEKEYKFPMAFDDKDFEVEKTMEIFARVKEQEPPVVQEEVVNTFEEQVDEPPKEVAYDEPPKYEYQEKVVVEETPQRVVVEQEHRLYEGKERIVAEEKKTFTPSPIISPIYGVLNKNYKKEEIVTKQELKSAQVSNRKDNLDLVREKAYGDLAGDISASIEDDVEVIDIREDKKKDKVEKTEKEEKKDLLYDLSQEEPTVKTVTVGDAEEYFNDLGLEYNVDYKVEKEEPKEEKKVVKKTRVESNKDDDDESDKNLFDLIDAMYEDEEKE